MRNGKNEQVAAGYRACRTKVPHQLPATKTHPFTGQLLDGKQAASWLIDALKTTKLSVDICSAFLRSEALQALVSKNNSHFDGRILVRWQLGDLLVGASDLHAYTLAKQLGFKFFLRQDFHGKVFSIPGVGVLVGSANATLSGFGIGDGGNTEVCTLVPSMESNLVLIDDIFKRSVEIDDVLFSEIGLAIVQILENPNTFQCWPSELLKKLQVTELVSRLRISELLVSTPIMDISGSASVTQACDRQLLGIKDIPISSVALLAVFKDLKIFNWLKNQLELAGGELYFGAVTQALHDSLSDDPAVSRRDIKNFLQILLSWCELLPNSCILIDRPRHSQRIRLG